MTALRTLLFRTVFFGLSVPIVLIAPVVALFGQRAFRGWVVFWTRFHAWCARYLMGIRVRVEGAPLATPALYAAKHQSFFETFELVRMLGAPTVVMRQEFARIPVWGWAARRYGVIIIDRSGSANALRQMMREARAAGEEGRSVILFPEGTRSEMGEAPPVQAGLAGLYRAVGLPAVPVALDTARVWPKHGPMQSGVVTFRFGAPIPAGLKREEVEARVHREINALNANMQA
ncbi:1-acyl-sn-glycerol-3-phosphate acyltransferase [Sphingomonas naasensis]|uniref:1-acyl-sn-glycerol-3-phosphate acyltransferase n=1 Tax=Sphingomonas naasensis TaxID=1344951 RepID=A0A4S1W710_9SPHN|nr:lysophospholipid acyltransferase family protein [Sphingomonas naasensis]NIJ21206.1 1-acyl-sn-glycerol-3-phosphate acyltransferase [Sphingomonas naasensis]TGX38651.1 1-acyl-sn-glycerol-3-phosphate acyltransferase [Sphingomonas naasensis]